MARSECLVILIGNLGADPDLRYSPHKGVPITALSVARTRSYKDKDGQWQDCTEWHRVVVWGRRAELAHKYLQKGSRVYVRGDLRTRTWDDKSDGHRRSITEIVADDLIMLSSPRSAEDKERDAYNAAWANTPAPSNETEPPLDDNPF